MYSPSISLQCIISTAASGKLEQENRKKRSEVELTLDSISTLGETALVFKIVSKGCC